MQAAETSADEDQHVVRALDERHPAAPVHAPALAQPVGDRIWYLAAPDRTVGAPPEGPGMWERAVRAYRRCPGIRVEPWPGSIVDSIENVKALLADVLQLRPLLGS